MNPVLENLLTRRSVRKFEDRAVTDEELDTILNAGLYAPSGMNVQETVLVAVRDKETLKDLSDMNAAAMMMGPENDPFYGAPCAVVVLAQNNENGIKDGALVMGNLMLAAHSLGLGSCWINRARPMFESTKGKAYLKEWGLSEELCGIGVCILGAPAEEPKAAPRKEGRIVKIG